MRKLIPLLLLCLAAPALAVQSSHWVQTNEADFKQGKFTNVVATNLGDLKLSRATKTLLEDDARISAVYALAEAADGTIYAGTGPQGVLIQIKDDKAKDVLKLDDNTNISALLVDARGRLLVGVSGDKGRVLRIDTPGAKPVEIFSAEDVQFIWSMLQTPDGNIYVATGPKGQLFQIAPDGSKSIILKSDENNLLTMISDGKDQLYVGTDPNGLVYRVNRKTKEAFVLFDAPESEVSALALDAKGNLYAGTAEANPLLAMQPDEPGATEKVGRPEENTVIPLPGQKPENPKPPALPSPTPGEPPAIPKGKSSLYISPIVHSDLLDDPAEPDPTPGLPSKKKPPAAGHGAASMPSVPESPTPVPTQPDQTPHPEGNAIYRVDADGFVTEIFRQPVMVVCMIEHNGTLLVGTGDDGLVYQLNPAAEETLVLAKVDPKVIMSMLPAKDGRVLLGSANVGTVQAMSSGYAAEGAYTSAVLDATQVSRFGKMHIQGSLPAGTALSFATRSGNIQDADKAGWSKWSDEATAEQFLPVTAPSARFLQYRVTFTSKDAKESPVVDEVDIAYQMPNMAPVIKSIKVGGKGATGATPGSPADLLAELNPAAAAGAGADSHTLPITWEVSDPNADALEFSLYFRDGATAPWILLKEKLKEPHFDWDTHTVADGRYEVKVLASDAGANPPGQGKTASRISDPVLVDNAAPAIGDVKTEVAGGKVTVSAKLVDRISTVASCEYSVDSNADWQAVLPSDSIFDSPEETVGVTVADLPPGNHQITLRASDTRGNRGYETIVVTIPGAAATQPAAGH